MQQFLFLSFHEMNVRSTYNFPKLMRQNKYCVAVNKLIACIVGHLALSLAPREFWKSINFQLIAATTLVASFFEHKVCTVYRLCTFTLKHRRLEVEIRGSIVR